LAPIEPEAERRVPGSARSHVEILPDFDEPLPEFEEL
jgi:hypothetical protein